MPRFLGITIFKPLPLPLLDNRILETIGIIVSRSKQFLISSQSSDSLSPKLYPSKTSRCILILEAQVIIDGVRDYELKKKGEGG